MDYNYHTHTYRCGHAIGEDEEYIKVSIQNGIKHLGFSDHIPFAFPDGYESFYRVKLSDALEYFENLNTLREKYKDKIEIKIGFEMEYYPNHFEKMLENAINFGAEYLILGQHFLYNEYPDGVYSADKISSKKEVIKNLKEYVKNIIDGIKSGVFSYVAHPDLIYYAEKDLLYSDEMRKICVASREYNTPLEINLLGIRDKRAYPCDEFFKIAGEEQSPVVIGFDAHTPKDAFDKTSLDIAKKLIEKYNLNYIGKPKLKSPIK